MTCNKLKLAFFSVTSLMYRSRFSKKHRSIGSFVPLGCAHTYRIVSSLASEAGQKLDVGMGVSYCVRCATIPVSELSP